MTPICIMCGQPANPPHACTAITDEEKTRAVLAVADAEISMMKRLLQETMLIRGALARGQNDLARDAMASTTEIAMAVGQGWAKLTAMVEARSTPKPLILGANGHELN